MHCPRCNAATRFYAAYAGNQARVCPACGTFTKGPR